MGKRGKYTGHIFLHQVHSLTSFKLPSPHPTLNYFNTHNIISTDQYRVATNLPLHLWFISIHPIVKPWMWAYLEHHPLAWSPGRRCVCVCVGGGGHSRDLGRGAWPTQRNPDPVQDTKMWSLLPCLRGSAVILPCPKLDQALPPSKQYMVHKFTISHISRKAHKISENDVVEGEESHRRFAGTILFMTKKCERQRTLKMIPPEGKEYGQSQGTTNFICFFF